MFISFVASPLMKYAFFALLDEINGIFMTINLNILYFLHTRSGLTLFLPNSENDISNTPYQPLGRIKIKQPHVGRQVTLLLCQSVVKMLCRISARPETSGRLFFKNTDMGHSNALAFVTRRLIG